MTDREFELFDRRHLWHPYSGMDTPRPALPVKSTEGVYLELADGRRLIDGISSWWTMAHGHRRPEIVKAMVDQLNIMPHVMFGGLTHLPAAELGERLLAVAPEGLTKIFYSDSGSVACEVAMKMAIQYFFAKGKPAKNRFLTVEHTYHGDTFATMALGKHSGMHHVFADILEDHFTAPAPPMGFDNFRPSDLDGVREILERHSGQIAAAILEPILQGAGGMRVYSPRYLASLSRLCKEYDVLLILDEIATGFGRTGEFFACNYADVSPDIMCVGKALTGGHITLAATLCNDRVAAGISSGEPRALMHGPTFMANPVACAAAVASLELFDRCNWQSRVKKIEAQLAAELAPAKALAGVRDVRVIGAVGAVELTGKVDCDDLCAKFARRGCWIRPLGNVVYLMPPFIIESGELSTLTRAVVETLKEEENAL